MLIHTTSGRWRFGFALSLLTMFLWGILPIALSIVLPVLDVYTITWFRFLISFGLLSVILTLRKELPNRKKLFSTSVLKLGAIAIINLAINYLGFLQGLKQTSPTNAEVLIQLAPVLMGLGGLIVFREQYRKRQWFGLATLVLGLILFFHEQLQTVISAPKTYLLGNLILIIAAATWAVYALAQKQLLKYLPSASIMLILYGGCLVLFSPLATPQAIFELKPIYFVFLLFCGLNTLVAYGAFSEALEHLEASRVSAILALAPLVTLLSSWIFSLLFPQWVTPEHFTVLGVLGAILVVVGAVLIALGKQK